MALKLRSGGHAQEVVEESGVANVDLGRLHLPLLEIRAPGFQAPQHVRRLEGIEIPAHGVMGDAERPAELRSVPHLSVIVSQHRPEAFEGRALDGDAELRNVALEEGANEVAAPAKAVGMAPGRVGRREAAAEPEVIGVARVISGRVNPGSS